MARLLRSFLPLLGVAFLLVSFACVEPGARRGDPSLPDGFGALVPDAPLGGYVYFSQAGGQPFDLNTHFLAPDDSVFPLQGRVSSIALWLSPVERDAYSAMAARIVFVSPEDAFNAETSLMRAIGPDVLWTKGRAEALDVVVGGGLYARAFRDAMQTERFTTLSVARTGVWNTALALPRAAERRPLAAGFLQVPSQVLPPAFSYVKAYTGLDLSPIGGLFTQAGAGHVAFALYGESLPSLSFDMTLADLAANNLTALVLTDSGVPAPLLAWSFHLGTQRMGLTPVTMEGRRAYLYSGDHIVTLARTGDGVIYAALAFSEAEARDLMAHVRQ